MNRFVVVDDLVVVNLIIAESQEIAEQISGKDCIASESAGMGWVYDNSINEFIAPKEIEVEANLKELIVVEPIIEEPLPLAE